uniref:Glycosyl transferase family 1 domain-containing protein n=1 Tax=Eutreptiella gymnastica TaxID=73025 RepID=A0A7S1NGS4_9EUGL
MPEPIDTDFWSQAAAGYPKKLPKRRVDRRDKCTPDGACVAHRTTKGGKCFAFLSVFKWEPRKGWDVLLEAFLREFDARQDFVCLYIKTSHFHSEGDFRDAITTFARDRLGIGPDAWKAQAPTIEVLAETIPHEDMPRLYKSVDAVVIPSRGEGWGRPHVEAMAMELPLIATNWSGPTAYMTEHNSYPLRIDHLETIKDGPWRGHRWAQPSVAHLRELLRRVYSDPEAAKETGRAARRDIVAQYSTGPVTALVLRRLEAIRSKLKRRHEQRALQASFSEESSAAAEAAEMERELGNGDGDLGLGEL